MIFPARNLHLYIGAFHGFPIAMFDYQRINIIQQWTSMAYLADSWCQASPETPCAKPATKGPFRGNSGCTMFGCQTTFSWWVVRHMLYCNYHIWYDIPRYNFREKNGSKPTSAWSEKWVELHSNLKYPFKYPLQIKACGCFIWKGDGFFHSSPNIYISLYMYIIYIYIYIYIYTI